MKDLSDLIIEFYERLSSWEHSVVEESGISLPQMHTIEILGGNESIRMKDLASKMGVTTGTLTVTIDRLEKRGLVKRIPNPGDRRSYVIRLTESGRKEYEKHSQYHYELTKECTGEFTESDINSFQEYLRRFMKNI